MMNCECPIAGFCDRHRRLKATREHELCQTDPRYFGMWEKKAGGTVMQPGYAKQLHLARPVTGPGTELKKLLAANGYATTKGCGCKDKTMQMNRMGVDGCRKNLETIIDWLVDSAKKAGWLERLAVSSPGVSSWARREIRGMIEEAIKRAAEAERSGD